VRLVPKFLLGYISKLLSEDKQEKQRERERERGQKQRE
jgi:hypothetical protein